MSTYATEAASEWAASSRHSIDVIRWALEAARPFAAAHGILATERLRTVKIKQYERTERVIPAALRGKIRGERIADDHRHAHWLWLDQGEQVWDLVLWIPSGTLDAIRLHTITRESDLSGYQRWNPAGFQPGRLHLVGLGSATSVVPELVGASMTWSSRTPYLPVMHRKRNQSGLDWLTADIAKECGYRGIPAPAEVSVQTESPGRAPTAQYRRHRWNEPSQKGRPGHWVKIQFPVPVGGPLSLGGLSHFGFGLFEPSGS